MRRMSTPASTNCVAAVCLSMCGVTFTDRLASRATFVSRERIAAGVSGRFARAALIDADELGRLADRDDRALAEHFGVPLAQIHRAKRELELRNRARPR
jgi:hypothetical protein